MPEGWLSSIFGQAGQGVAQTAGGELLKNSALFATPQVGQSLLSQIPNAGTYLANTAQPVAEEGLLSSLSSMLGTGGGKVMDLLKNEALTKGVGAGASLLGALSNFSQAKKAGKIMDRQQNLYEQSYARDVEADKKRQLLNF